jgi:hypothetical protein
VLEVVEKLEEVCISSFLVDLLLQRLKMDSSHVAVRNAQKSRVRNTSSVTPLTERTPDPCASNAK